VLLRQQEAHNFAEALDRLLADIKKRRWKKMQVPHAILRNYPPSTTAAFHLTGVKQKPLYNLLRQW
jgi:hypothetical protein